MSVEVQVSSAQSQVCAPRLPLSIAARTGEFIVAAVLAVVGAFFVWQSLRLPFGKTGLPGPGFFPLFLGFGLGAFALGIAADARRCQEPAPDVQLGHRDVIIVIVSLLAVCAGFETLGALVALGLFAMALLYFVARVPAVIAAVSAIAGMTAVWGFFKVLLGLQLPAGIL